MKLIKILSALSLTATIIIYLFPRTWQLDLIVGLQENQSSLAIGFWQVISDYKSLVSIGIPVVLLIVGFVRRDKPLREKAILVLLTLSLGGLLSTGVKNVVREPRPFDVDHRITKLSSGGSHGFPSGHTLEVAAAAAAFSYLWPQASVIFASSLWLLMTMYSRICLGVHDPGEVMGGLFLGLLSFLIVFRISEYFAQRKRRTPT